MYEKVAPEDLFVSVELIADELSGAPCIYAGLRINDHTYIDVDAPTVEYALLKLIKLLGEKIASFEGMIDE